MTTHQELYDEGAHWFDVTLARGIDTGRYRLKVDPQDPSKTRMVAGPNLLLLPAESWMAGQIDAHIEGRNAS